MASSTSRMTTVSRSTRSTKHFGLSDVDDLVVKKETKPLPVKKETPGMLTLGGRKRKAGTKGMEIFDGMESADVKSWTDSMMQSKWPWLSRWRNPSSSCRPKIFA